jgi:hypothetical protein
MDDRRGKLRAGIRFGGLVCSIAILPLVGGCAGEQSKPMAQPSTEQVKGHADRAFDNLKQEERDRKPPGM